MKHIITLLLVLLAIVTKAQNDYYQPQKQPAPAKRTYTIVLKDGTQLRGELVRQDSVEAVIRTNNLGEVRLKTDQIVRIEQEGAQAEGDVYPNLFPQTMRFAPTAFSAEKNKLYFRNYALYISQFEYGISDNWSVNASFFSFVPTALFNLSTKVSLPVSSRVRLGVNAQYIGLRDGGLFNGNSNSLVGIGYVQGIVTTGDRRNNTTYGLGWSVSNGELSRNVVGTFGLVRKVSPKLTFISENFVLLGGGGNVDFAGVVSAGVRFDRRRHAFDLALYVPFIVGTKIAAPLTLIPFVSYHLRIGK
ncbi:hypothetical protein [Spirosoma pollinicola]|uniref:DUF481 domain-containing protein n=1 Tax=Spirosoma pollinicola TaxID=2057025 RepID=A0A2K8Z1Y5_9BACT|nr:hypothetical protein [Spirosoma pollinicola]AUD03849.1 hypothetical protein CWM47_19665 [Spirosoma pollinicola]